MKVLPLLVFGCFLTCASAARILGIFTMAAKSHFSCNHAIMESLHAAGHHITMVTPFPSKEKVENFTYVDSRMNTFVYIGQSTIDELSSITLYSLINTFATIDIQYCYDVIKLKEIQEVLNSPQKLYDVMFVEILFAYECYLPIAEKLGIPIVGTVTLHTIKTADVILGVPNSPAIVPISLETSESEMSFSDRIQNLWNHFLCDYSKVQTRKAIKKFFREYNFSEDVLYKKDISLIFYNNHASLVPRPTTPNAVEIGGIHMKPPKPLPKDLQKFIDEATHGVVLFTFGSVVKASSLSVEKRQAFVDAFAAIPQRVLWKFEEPIKNLPKNIMLSNWLPQRDILEHKKVIAFISHCGQSGTYEAVMTGTPVVTIPLFADQFSNAARLQSRKVAVNLNLETVTKEKILAALNTIINDTSYYQRMQALSRVFKDRPMSPQESIVYWTEYVIRHNGTQYLKALGTDMPFYKYFMLDIVALIFVTLSIVIYVAYMGIRETHKLVSKDPNYAHLMKKKE